MEPAGILLLITFPFGPALLGTYAWYRCRGQTTSAPAIAIPLFPGVINASLAMALAFNAVYFVQEFFLAWPKSLLPGVEAVVYHNNHGWSGEHPDIILYQGAGALAIIILGLLLSVLGQVAGNRLKGFHPILWWSACMALGLGLVQVPIAAMHPDNDVGQAFDFLALSATVRLLLAFLCCATAIAFGLWLHKPLLAMAPPGALTTARARVIYVLKFAMLPLVLGSLIAWANRAPPIGHLTMPLFSGLFVLPWTLAVAALMPPPSAATDRVHRAWDWRLLIVSLIVLAIFRLVLAAGLSV